MLFERAEGALILLLPRFIILIHGMQSGRDTPLDKSWSVCMRLCPVSCAGTYTHAQVPAAHRLNDIRRYSYGTKTHLAHGVLIGTQGPKIY